MNKSHLKPHKNVSLNLHFRSSMHTLTKNCIKIMFQLQKMLFLCVCVCVRAREREKERKREIERERASERKRRKRKRKKVRKKDGYLCCKNCCLLVCKLNFDLFVGFIQFHDALNLNITVCVCVFVCVCV